MPQGPRLNLTQLSTLRELVRRGTLAAAAEHLGYTPGAARSTSPRSRRRWASPWSSGRVATWSSPMPAA